MIKSSVGTNSLFALCLIAGSSVWAQPDGAESKEFAKLEGIWTQDPPKKGQSRVNALYFKGDKLAWMSTRYEDGEAVIGHSKVYEVRLNPDTTPRQITLTKADKDDRQELIGIYEIKDKTLMIALGSDKKRPQKMDDKSA